MKKVAIIKKCKSGDAEEGKPWCLYSHEGKLLGRHPSKESARNQEEAIKANSSKNLIKKLSSVIRYLGLFE